MKLAAQHARPGVYVRGHPSTPFMWDGVIFVREGLYEGGVFRFRILIPTSYPDTTVPRLFFQSQLYHPGVDEITGETDLSREFSVWDPASDRLWHILRFVRSSMFSKPGTCCTARNEAAASLLSTDSSSFAAAAKKCVYNSQHATHAESANTLKFEHVPSSRHTEVLRELRGWQLAIAAADEGAAGGSMMVAGAASQALARGGPLARTHAAAGSFARLNRRAADAVAEALVPSGSSSRGYSTTTTTTTTTTTSRLDVTAAGIRLRQNVEEVLGPDALTLGDVRVGDAVAEGYVSLREQSQETRERRYLVLDAVAATLAAFETEKRGELVQTLSLCNVLRAFAPLDPESKASNAFVVVTTESVFYMHAPSLKAMNVWLRAIIHATTLAA